MVRRARLTVVFILVLAALVACTPEEIDNFKQLPADQQKVVLQEQQAEEEPPPPPPDPCADYQALNEGRGEPSKQEWFNHLRTDGDEPDYLRYYIACKPGERWDTKEYWCAHTLLDGEHGNKLWNTDHRNGEGVNIPQAKPVSKISGLDERGQLRWFFDYVENRYGSIWNTPRPCRAGY